jgi:hypothetical protein
MFASAKIREAGHGPIIAALIGLPVLRTKCAHFDFWIRAILAACIG